MSDAGLLALGVGIFVALVGAYAGFLLRRIARAK